MHIYPHLLIVALFSSTALASDDTLDITARIVGGQESIEGQWPWMVSINSGGYECGGTLIDEQTVLTAAHCLYDFSSEITATRISVKVGEYDQLSTPSTPRTSVIKTYIHPNYDPQNSASSNDIALLRLQTPITEITPVERATTSTTNDATQRRENVTALGWGSTVGYESQEEVTAIYPDILNEVVLPLQTDNQCKANLGNNFNPQSMVCAGLQQGGKDACQGDSGGPLVINNGGSWQQLGIVSWGVGCAASGYPGVYTRLAVYEDWIEAFLSGITIDKSISFNLTPIDNSEQKNLLISNNSDFDAQITTSISGSSDFAFDTSACTEIEAKTTCVMVVSYSPTGFNASEATILLTSDLDNTTVVSTTVTGTPFFFTKSGGSSSLFFLFALPILVIRYYRYVSFNR
ncbi:serine protease [Psychromonas sp. psych-6C06]|uniref:trypsin-like serine protease n=1 Tax=Psychromonas sp. psych-6C06 TaxID=2058089 RepID=UPI000C326A18|nr:trypsin-like serine protease [Psychromonas sp. psych-6C06]PKF63703.1 serine protease [Psychromonas sp. psych-6C06]